MSCLLLYFFPFLLFAEQYIFMILIGKEIGTLIAKGIFDPNSWGQFLGGTHSGHGRDVGFNDGFHIVGQAMRLNPSCVAMMMCSNITIPERNSTIDAVRALDSSAVFAPNSTFSKNRYERASMKRSLFTDTSASSGGNCYTAPFVRCNESDPWTRIWNLHVHSKQTEKFRSVSCRC